MVVPALCQVQEKQRPTPSQALFAHENDAHENKCQAVTFDSFRPALLSVLGGGGVEATGALARGIPGSVGAFSSAAPSRARKGWSSPEEQTGMSLLGAPGVCRLPKWPWRAGCWLVSDGT